jgi:hypothetical protein
MPPKPWPDLPPDRERFRQPPREYGILPFWFLNGELDPDEMRFQLRELRDKGMPGIILHGRFGLELPYLGPDYLDRIKLAVEESEKLGLTTWIYDEMNWPSGTADGRVLRERPDLAQRYIECISFAVRGPYFTYLTGQDSRYMDFERSLPVAAFAIGGEGLVIDLTPNLSFEKVIPWQVPPGNWRILYIVEKLADYYIDAINPEATAEFLRLGYEPYLQALGDEGPRTKDQGPRTEGGGSTIEGSNEAPTPPPLPHPGRLHRRAGAALLRDGRRQPDRAVDERDVQPLPAAQRLQSAPAPARSVLRDQPRQRAGALRFLQHADRAV